MDFDGLGTSQTEAIALSNRLRHQLDRLVDDDPESLLEAPRHTPVGRLDETRANRQLDVRWRAGR